MLLEFNPVAEKRKGYRAQKVVSQHFYAPKGIQQQFLNQFLSQYPCSLGYFSPFRSFDDKQLSEQDLALSLPLFERYIELIKPVKVLVFSSYLVEVLQEKALLSEYINEEISIEGRTILVARGQLEVAGHRCPILFLPSATSRLPRPLKEAAWAWAFGDVNPA